MAKAKRTAWTREELLVALNLYHKIPFSQISSRLPVVIELAEKMGRTPASISMKLGNLGSFDPVLQLRGYRGLKGASHLDKAVWEEYHNNAAELIPASQAMFDKLFIQSEDETTEVIPTSGVARVRRATFGITETSSIRKLRRGQDYFRDVVLNNFGNACGVTGLGIRELLVASHILPWSKHESERLNVRNGISLNRLHDAAFDKHLISFDENLCLMLSPKLRSFFPNKSAVYLFEAFEGNALSVPDDGITPEPAFLASHRSQLVS